jgi:predicted ATP-grasp superfamily ATP-dependent carboligase
VDVLVTGAEGRDGLAVIRALGSKGLNIFAAGAYPWSLGFYSRYVRGSCCYPSLMVEDPDKQGFVSAIRDAVKRHRIPWIFPVSEASVVALDEARGEFEGLARIALPPSRALRAALDKHATHDLAVSLDIPVPRTCLPGSLEEAFCFASELGYPIVMKPRGPREGRLTGGLGFKVRYARSREDLGVGLRGLAARAEFPILQEYCSGLSVAQSGVFANGEILGLYQHRRAREYPLTGGVASVVVSESIDPRIREWTQRLMRALQWDGAAQVEYRVDRATGRTLLLEVNGRWWAPLSASNKLGLNFPYALYRYLEEGYRQPLSPEYPVGVRARYLRGDLFALQSYFDGSTVEFLTPLPSKRAVVWAMLKDFSPLVKSDVWDWADPYPALRELVSMARTYAGVIARWLLRRIPRRGSRRSRASARGG